jgi:S1-C subfamily serine protease
MHTRAFVLGSAAALLAAGLLAPLRTEGAAGPLSAREAADRGRTKVVVLKTERAAGPGSATGFLAAPGVVLTAAHALADAGRVTGWLNGVAYGAETMGTHAEYDLAALRLRTGDLLLKPIALAPTSLDLRAGDELVILAGPSQPPGARGDPADRALIPARFHQRVLVRGVDGKLDLMLALDARIRKGDSGSPLIRARDGSVVGIVVSREQADLDGVSLTAYAVPVEVVHPWLAQLQRARDEFYLFGLPPRR